MTSQVCHSGRGSVISDCLVVDLNRKPCLLHIAGITATHVTCTTGLASARCVPESATKTTRSPTPSTVHSSATVVLKTTALAR